MYNLVVQASFFIYLFYGLVLIVQDDQCDLSESSVCKHK